jgi:hypothetical protein
VGAATERGEQPADQGGVVDGRLARFREPPLKPPRAGPAAADARITLRDQRGELERLREGDGAELACGDLRGDDVPALECPVEDGAGAALGCDGAPSRGRAGADRG